MAGSTDFALTCEKHYLAASGKYGKTKTCFAKLFIFPRNYFFTSLFTPAFPQGGVPEYQDFFYFELFCDSKNCISGGFFSKLVCFSKLYVLLNDCIPNGSKGYKKNISTEILRKRKD